MEKQLTEALKKILPENQVKGVSKALSNLLEQKYRELESEFQEKLEEAYQQLLEEKEEAERIATQGYEQAYGIICDLMKRLETQKQEFERALEEGFEEAYQELLKERQKRENLEVELYEEYDRKLKQIKDYMVDKVDEFLSIQESELYEAAKREVLNDPTVNEQRVVVSKIAELLSDYMNKDELGAVASTKLEEAKREIEDLKSRIRIIEARNTRLSAHNTRLEEQVRHANRLLSEATVAGRKARASKKRNVSGRGHKAFNEGQILNEYANDPGKNRQHTLNEGDDPLNDLLILSGIQDTK